MNRITALLCRLVLVSLLALAACNYRNSHDEPSDGSSVDSTAEVDSSDTSSSDVEDSSDQQMPVEQKNISVSDPQPGTRIEGTSFTATGLARTFENGVAYRLIDSNGMKLANGHTTSRGEMGSFNPYSITITVPTDYSGRATLEVFQNSAKDGSPIDMVAVPLTIIAGQQAGTTNTLQVYFTNRVKNTSQDCEHVFAVSRATGQTVAVAEEALKQLLVGPTATERKAGYSTELPEGTRLRSIVIAGGVARADFSAELNRGGGACHAGAIHAQIERTLKQFPTVKEVEISVDGSSADALQP